MFISPFGPPTFVTAWSSGLGPKEYGLYLANKRKKYQPKQTNKKKNFKK